MRKSLGTFLFIFLVGAASVMAKTPDGKTPSEETICDNEQGAAYGLCNAYCEAMDCTDPEQRAANPACQAVKDNFEKRTGRAFPCEATCPCPGMIQLFSDIESGSVTVTRCIVDDENLFVVTSTGSFAFISNGPPAFCSDSGQEPFIELTGPETLLCRIQLRRAAEAQGVTCRSPE